MLKITAGRQQFVVVQQEIRQEAHPVYRATFVAPFFDDHLSDICRIFACSLSKS